jgi:hypothetical protein
MLEKNIWNLSINGTYAMSTCKEIKHSEKTHVNRGPQLSLSLKETFDYQQH